MEIMAESGRYQDFMSWINNVFRFPVPNDYLKFILRGDFITTLRQYYIVNYDKRDILEISEWFTYDNIHLVYANCLDEEMIEKHHLPIFDSCNCTIIIDCNAESDCYGNIFLRTPTGFFDEKSGKNVYTELKFVAKNFTEIISSLKTADDLERMGIL